MSRAAVTLSALIFIIIVPVLEISETHLFSPDWPAHARLHEAWQLLTNGFLSVIALLLVWRWQRGVIALVACLAIALPFIAAWLLESFYGGSMRHADGTELTVAGVNSGVLLMFIATGMLLFALAKEIRQLQRVHWK